MNRLIKISTIVLLLGLFIITLSYAEFDSIEVRAVAPKFKIGEHVIIISTGDEAVVTGLNGYSSIKRKTPYHEGPGWTMKVTLVQSRVTLPKIHEDRLRAIKK